MGAAFTVILTVLRGALPLAGGFLTGGASVLWGALQGLWATEIGRLVLISIGCLIGGFVWGFHHEHAVKAAAIEAATRARDAEWQQEIAAANAKNEERIKEALDAARKVSVTPPAGDALVELCRKSPSCRGAFVKRLVVQAPRRNVVN